MAKNKTNTPPRRPSMDQRIKSVLDEGPLAALFFSAAIDTFKDVIEQLKDEQIAKMFCNLIHPNTVRNCVKHIYNRLNLIDDE